MTRYRLDTLQELGSAPRTGGRFDGRTDRLVFASLFHAFGLVLSGQPCACGLPPGMNFPPFPFLVAHGAALRVPAGND